MKRNGFVSIQNAHTIACKGYRPSYIQTGYENIIGQRTDKMFCFAASQGGKVLKMTDKAIQVQYDDGTIETAPVGRQYGSAEGSTYPHDVASTMKEGEKFQKGDAITYNKGFFAPDAVNPKRVTFMMSLPANVMYREDSKTHEDSCAISPSLGKLLETATTKVKSYVVKFDDILHNVAAQGKPLQPGDILMAIEAAVTGGTGGFDVESASKLSAMGRQIPTSSYTGVLDRIEVYYHGEKVDMHPTLKALADRSDKFFGDQSKDLDKPKINGRVDGDWSVKGKPLVLGEAEVRFLITVGIGMAPGDKLVFANQLKTTGGELLKTQMVTESGRVVDAEFSGRAAIKRIVNSHGLQGTTIGNMQALNQLFVKTYRQGT